MQISWLVLNTNLKMKMKTKKTLVVNLYGGPGIGKSTLAHSVYAELKWLGINCEFVSEFAKDMVWEESNKTLTDQLFVLANQSHRQFVLSDVNIIITDSPLLLGLLYSTKKRHKSKEFNKVILNEYESYNNLNILLKRNKKVKFQQKGRIHNLKESKKIDKQIENLLVKYKSGYTKIIYKRSAINKIVELIIKKSNINK
jgi:thymidylate kinase